MHTRPLTPTSALLAAVSAALAAGIGASSSTAADRAPAATCSSVVSKGLLPVWARTGFSDAKPRATHVLGRAGSIAAILFGYPLHAPPSAKGRQNKILWVSRASVNGSDLHIRAQRRTAGRPSASPSRAASPTARARPSSICRRRAAGTWR
ncbi:MAG: hypothetical protein QOC95_2080 [Thermoleophilaceae bacterium]|nr:hypothetical protein [Thermoleophilaceae bacterium]